MARVGMFLGPLVLVLWIFCLFDVITSREDEVRHLPKWGWLVLVLLFPLVGSVAWLAVGRPRRTSTGRRSHERPAPSFPEYDRPGRAAAVDAESDEDFLRRCRERAEEQRRKHQEEQRRRREELDGTAGDS